MYVACKILIIIALFINMYIRGGMIGVPGGDPFRGNANPDALAITPAVFDFQIEECLPQVIR